MGILLRYHLRHWAVNFLLAFCVMSTVLLIGNLVRYGSRLGLLALLPVIPALLPGMLMYSLPMAGLSASVTTVTLARRRGEFSVLAAAGHGTRRLIPLYMGLGILLSLITYSSLEWIQPAAETWKRRHLASVGADLVAAELRKTSGMLTIGNLRVTFFTTPSGRSVVLQRREQGRIREELFAHGVHIELDRDNNQLALSMDEAFGMRYQVADGPVQPIRLSQGVRMPLSLPEITVEGFSYRQLPLSEMRRLLRHPPPGLSTEDHDKLKSLYHEKWAMILSPFALLLAAFPLGFIGNPSSRLSGFMLGLCVVFLFYYPLLVLARKLVQTGLEPAVLIMQGPNIGLLLIGLFGSRKLDRRV